MDSIDFLRNRLAAQGNADAQAQQQQAARDAFVAANLKDVPASFAGKLGTDPAKWQEESKSIRAAYKADLNADLTGGQKAYAAGLELPPAAPTGKPLSTLTAGQRAFAEGLKLPE